MSPPPLLILPFALLLGAMAFAPVLAPHWWEKHYPKIALGLGAITVGIYVFALHDTASLAHTAHEYFSFVALVASLFIVACGIHIRVRARATPVFKVIFLLVGAVLANVVGTTGAAMLLIRPWLHLNRRQISARHIAFFIFIVANVGGCLTPIGDPPLFLGFLQGISFWWLLQKCWPIWLIAIGLLLLIFYVLERFFPSPTVETGPDNPEEGWKFDGLSNLFFLAVILGAVFINQPVFLREILTLAAAVGSWFTTKKAVHHANGFNFHPVAEVVILFAGIFATMTPALAWLNHHASSVLGHAPSPALFYWGTGCLSAVLDNAPTYLGFLSTLRGIAGDPDTTTLLAGNSAHILAISIGAVFFGAATYLGNGPNFMVKSIARHGGARTPSFLGFIFRFTLPFLLPVLVIVWLLFFRS